MGCDLKMTPKQKVMSLAKEIGSTVIIDRSGRYFDIEVEAPEGYFWTEGCDCHVLVANQFQGSPTAPLWKDLYDRMKCGLMPCTEHECEFWD